MRSPLLPCLARRAPRLAARLLVATCALAAGCAGDGLGLDDNGDVPTGPVASDGGTSGDGGHLVNFRDIQSTIFSPICASRCHAGATAPKGLQLDAANAWNLIVGVKSVEVPALSRVDPGHPENSYLIVKLAPIDVRRDGERMPRNGPPYLSTAQITMIRRWIQEGAPK